MRLFILRRGVCSDMTSACVDKAFGKQHATVFWQQVLEIARIMLVSAPGHATSSVCMTNHTMGTSHYGLNSSYTLVAKLEQNVGKHVVAKQTSPQPCLFSTLHITSSANSMDGREDLSDSVKGWARCLVGCRVNRLYVVAGTQGQSHQLCARVPVLRSTSPFISYTSPMVFHCTLQPLFL